MKPSRAAGYFRNGDGTYYARDPKRENQKPEDTRYGGMFSFLLGTLIANRGNALDA